MNAELKITTRIALIVLVVLAALVLFDEHTEDLIQKTINETKETTTTNILRELVSEPQPKLIPYNQHQTLVCALVNNEELN